MRFAINRGTRSSFVVRVVEDRWGQFGGVIERVATGAKEAFSDLEAIGAVIREMLREQQRRRSRPASGVRKRSKCPGTRRHG